MTTESANLQELTAQGLSIVDNLRQAGLEPQVLRTSPLPFEELPHVQELIDDLAEQIVALNPEMLSISGTASFLRFPSTVSRLGGTRTCLAFWAGTPTPGRSAPDVEWEVFGHFAPALCALQSSVFLELGDKFRSRDLGLTSFVSVDPPARREE